MTQYKPKAARRAKGTSAISIYEALREEILTMQLEPGEMLDETTISKRFGTSRSPVREAFVRLSADGLIRTLPNKNTMVIPLSIEDFPKYMDALDLIQRAVTRLAALERTPQDIERMVECQKAFREAVYQEDAVKMIDANRNFHVAISEAGKNRYFTHLYARLLDEGRRVLRVYYRSYKNKPPRQMVGTHDEIIKAIRSQDADRAEQLAHEHAGRLEDRFLEFLGRRATTHIQLREG